MTTKKPKFDIDHDNPCDGCPIKCAKPKSKAKVTKGAPFLLVGKAPSAQSLKDGRIIPPKATRTVIEGMASAGLPEDMFSWASAVRCEYDMQLYNAKQRREIEYRCRQHLLKVIEHCKPEAVIPMGADATRQVLGRAAKITKVRGLCTEGDGFDAKVIPITDPVSVSMYPQNAPILQSDCDSVGRLYEFDYDTKRAESQAFGEYEQIYDLQFLIDMEPKEIAFDVETQGKRAYMDDTKILTMQFCVEPGKAYLLSWDHPDDPYPRRGRKRIIEQLTQLLCRKDVSIIGQGLKFDVSFLLCKLGIRIRIDQDTNMLAAIVDENLQNKDLDTLTKIYAPEMAGYADRFNATYDKSDMASVPLSEILSYGCGDTDACMRVYKAIRPIAEADEMQWRSYRYVSIPGLNAFASFENNGMDIDEDGLNEFQKVLTEQVAEEYDSLIGQVHRAIRRKWVDRDKPQNGLSFGRADFTRDVLFTHPKGFKLKPKVYTSTTEKLEAKDRVPSISTKDHLPFFFDVCPFTAELSNYIKNDRLLGTNVLKFKENFLYKGKIYPIYGLSTAVTGRTNCLREDQLVDTRYGRKRADEIVVGDEVFTHKGRFRPVTKLFRKPVTDMVDITLSNGEVMHVTYDHVVLLNSGEFVTVRSLLKAGVDHAKRIQEAHARQGTGTCGSGSLPYVDENGAGSSGRVWGESRNCEGDDSTAYIRQGLQEIRALQISRKQAGRKESSVWEDIGIRLRGWQGLPYEISEGKEALCTQDSDGRNARHTRGRFTGESGSTPHRRGPDEQPAEQPCTDHAAGPCGDSRTVPISFRGVSIKAVDHSGSYRVYDFEVAEDRSYLASGVFSHNSRDPNGQNFPKRGKSAKAYRKIFVPPPGYVQLEADLSQAELRITADMANEQTMLGIYAKDGDIHRTTYCEVMGIAETDFLKLPEDEQGLGRFKAKAVNFGFIYGMWWKKFVGYAKTQYGVEFTDSEAKEIRESFFRLYPGLEAWHNSMRKFAQKNGYVRSYDGRVRHLPQINSDVDYIQQEALRQAINSPVQEFASSLGVMSMSRITTQINPEYLRLTGFVHDALYAVVPEEYVEWGAKTLKYYMESNPIFEWFGRKMKVDIKADVGFGMNGGEVHEMKRLDFSRKYDFGVHEGMKFKLPKQKIPKDNGMVWIPPHMQAPEEIHLWD